MITVIAVVAALVVGAVAGYAFRGKINAGIKQVGGVAAKDVQSFGKKL